MPALRICGFRTAWSADDLAWPMVVSAVMNVLFLVVGWHYTLEGMCETDEKAHATMDMDERRTYRSMITITCLSVSIQLIMQCKLVAESLKYSIMEGPSDNYIERLAFFYCGISVWILMCGIVTTTYNYLHLEASSKCSTRAVGESASSLGGAFFVLLMWTNIAMHLMAALPQKVYEKFMIVSYNFLGRPLCWIFGFRDSEFAVLRLVGQRWSRYLEPMQSNHIALTPSDFIAGLVVLGQYHRKSTHRRSRKLRTNSRDVESGIKHGPEASRSKKIFLSDALYFVRYAVGAYGWILEMYMLVLSPRRGLRFTYEWLRAKLAMVSNCLSSESNAPSSSSSNDFRTRAFDNTAALCRQTGLAPEDICHVSFENNRLEKPWFVALDRSRECVVLSIRGSLSAADVITDMAYMDPSADCEVDGSESLSKYADEFGFVVDTEKDKKEATDESNISATSLPGGSAVHYGILSSAIWIAREIRSRGILDKAFAMMGGRYGRRQTTKEDGEDNDEDESGPLLGSAKVKEAAQASIPIRGTADTASRRLVIVGHSLGAGVASVLAVLLRPAFANVECIAFSPPGGLMSPALSRWTRSFVRTIVLGDDIIPRISLENFDKLRTRVVECGCRSSEKKFYLPFLASCSEFSSEKMPASCTQILSEYREAVGYQQSTGRFEDARRMILPGRVLHLTRSRESVVESLPCILSWSFFCVFTMFCRRSLSCGSGGSDDLTSNWIRSDALDEILISMHIIRDHMPDVLEPALRRAIENLRS